MSNVLAAYGFPDSYNSIVTGSASVKYVSASGSDSNNGNTVTTPYLTIAQALSATSATATSVTIVILAGTYNISATSGGTGCYCISDGGNPRLFVCSAGQVTIVCTDTTGARDFSPLNFVNSSSAIYGAIIKRNNSGRTTSYTVSLFNDETVSFKGYAYNTVFQETNSNNAWSVQYDNGGNSTGKLYNCTFYNGANATGDYSGAAGLVITDSVFNTTYATSSATFTGVLTSQTVNATTYVTTSVTTKGVYSGTYAWNGFTTPLANGFLNPANTVFSGTTINFTLYDSASANVSYTITGVTTADLNGTSLTGYFTSASGAFTLSVPTKVKVAETKTLSITTGTYSANVVITPGLSFEALIVAGGGSGGNHNTTNANGGGGAGGVLRGSISTAGGVFAVAVGAGGAAIGNAIALNGLKGTDSGLGSYIAEGGGGGGSSGVGFSSSSQNGGSGGGNAYYQSGGGLANNNLTAGTLTVLGNNGGSTSTTWTGAGGGGAGAAGVSGSGSSPGGNGGTGITNDWTGTTRYLAGGGGGGGNSSERAGDGFYGGGRGEGTTSYYSYNVYTNEINATTKGSGIPTAVVNTGGGGGGGSYWASNGGWYTGSGAGGSGIVIIQYAGSQKATGGTVTTVGSNTVHTFTTSGTFEVLSGGLSASANTLYWGDTLTLRYSDDLADGSNVAYTISGVSSSQINGASLTGNFTFANSTSQLIIQTTPTTATSNTLTITAGSYTLNIPITFLISLTGPVGGSWGANLTYTAATRGLSNNTLIPYTITGSNVTSSQLNSLPLTGTITNIVSALPLGSNYFDGTGDFLTIPNGTAFQFGTGDFTIEFWIKTTDGSVDIINQYASGGTNWAFIILSGSIYWQNSNAASSLYYLALSGLNANPTSGSWTHVALTRTSGVLKYWTNGVGHSVTQADTTNYAGSASVVRIGSGYYGEFLGNISNLRVVKGVAVYTSNFTPSVTPLFATQSSGTGIAAITGTQTSLLTCKSQTTLTDYSTNAFVVTGNGNVAANTEYPGTFTSAGPTTNLGTGTLIVTTNTSAPLLSSANGFINVGSNTIAFTIRTSTAVVMNSFSTSVDSFTPINTITTDIHSQNVEAILSSNESMAITVLNPITNQNTLVFINTITTDIHSQNVEGIVTVSTNSFNSVVTSNTINPSISTIVPLPTYAYSSGTEISANGNAISAPATVTQTWYI
jgi:hypothetical protein